MLHDVVSIRSDRSRRRPRSLYTPPKKTLWRRFKDVFRTVIAFVFSNVGICVLVLVYLILGLASIVNKYYEMLEAQLRLKLDMFFKLTALPLSTAWSTPRSLNIGGNTP